jgi:hypothetical protein
LSFIKDKNFSRMRDITWHGGDVII